jgi:predicted phage terminase large subunit-like protein
MELKRRYSPSTLLIEDSPISLGLIQSLREQSINVTTYKPDTDKRARLIAQTDLFAGGSVRLPRCAGWLEEFVAELLSFPGATTIKSMLSPKASPGVANSGVAR